MKILIAIFCTLLLSACGDDGPADVGAPENSGKGPSPKKELHWGDLRCQKEKKCTDPVLNVSLGEIREFAARALGRHTEKVPTAFACGRSLGQTWAAVTRSPVTGGVLDDFFLTVIEPATCLPYADLDLRLENYFKNHGEVKNEIR